MVTVPATLTVPAARKKSTPPLTPFQASEVSVPVGATLTFT